MWVALTLAATIDYQQPQDSCRFLFQSPMPRMLGNLPESWLRNFELKTYKEYVPNRKPSPARLCKSASPAPVDRMRCAGVAKTFSDTVALLVHKGGLESKGSMDIAELQTPLLRTQFGKPGMLHQATPKIAPK